MIQIAICDDCVEDRKSLIMRIKDTATEEDICIKEYSSGQALLTAMENIVFAAIFLDVQMKEMDGNETAEEATFEIVLRFLFQNHLLQVASWASEGGTSYFLMDYLFKFLFLLIIERPIKKLNLEQNQRFAWYLMIMPVVSIIILGCLMSVGFPDSILIQGLVCIGALLLYFSNAAIFIILEKYTAILEKREHEELYRMKQEIEADSIKDILELNEKYRCYMHDIHAYLRNIRLLAMEGENQSIVSIINEKEALMEAESSGKFYSGNSVLNAIFAERDARAKSSAIEIEFQVEKFLDIGFISDADMVSLFGNLIDNAIEAAGQCEDGKRRVKVRFFMGNQYMLVFRIDNTFKVEPEWDGDELLTTKKDTKQHGLGVGIARNLIHKYGGTLTLEVKENVFVTTAIISSAGRYG